jgi:hypothetical protein
VELDHHKARTSIAHIRGSNLYLNGGQRIFHEARPHSPVLYCSAIHCRKGVFQANPNLLPNYLTRQEYRYTFILMEAAGKYAVLLRFVKYIFDVYKPVSKN